MMGKSHDEHMIELFRADPAFAADLLNDIFEDGDDQGELRLILQHITAAGLRVSPVSVTPKAAATKAKPAARTRPGAAKKTPRARKKVKTAAGSGRSRTRAVAAGA